MIIIGWWLLLHREETSESPTTVHRVRITIIAETRLSCFKVKTNVICRIKMLLPGLRRTWCWFSFLFASSPHWSQSTEPHATGEFWRALMIITNHILSRSIQDARRNTPLRHLLPIAEDRPPPYMTNMPDSGDMTNIMDSGGMTIKPDLGESTWTQVKVLDRCDGLRWHDT